MPDGGAFPPQIAVTLFYSKGAGRKTDRRYTLPELRDAILAAKAKSKDELPWLKLARFGGDRTLQGSLRHDANVLGITGIEADYDGERVSPSEAVERLDKAGIRALVYTSPTHTEDAPRWRVLCPTSTELPPERREHLVGRLNGLLGGILAAESFTLSQAYYFGRIGENPSHVAELVDGRPIDLCDELDEGAIGRPSTKTGNAGGDGGGPKRGKADTAALLAEIVSGASYHEACVRLLGVWAFGNVPMREARDRLFAAFDAVPEADRDARWQQRRDDVERCVLDIYGKEGGQKDRGKRKRKRQADQQPNPEAPGAAAEPMTKDGRQGDGGCELVSEDAVSLAFAAKHRDDLRFCHTIGKWYRWTDTHWQRDDTKLAFSWARRIARQLAQEADNARVMVSAGRAAFAAGVERFCQADRAFAVTSQVWDSDRDLLGTPGGTVDLRTGIVMPPRRDLHISKITAVAPADDAHCSTWLGFLDQATARDAGLIRFLKQWCGYCLSGSTREHALLFIYGPGGNGKSVFLNTVAGILGDYHRTAAMDTFTEAGSRQHLTFLAMLHGARMVTASETEEGRAWAESRIKQMTGGDPITANVMRHDPFTFTPVFKLTIAGNHKPALRNVDDAARRRFNIVPFLHKPETPDRGLEAKLRKEWPGILRWMIEGCLDWQRNGLARPEVVTNATAEYFSEQDLVKQWLGDCCDVGRNESDTTEALFKSWTAYALATGEKPGTAKWFAQVMQRQGFQSIKDVPGHRNKRGFAGVAVRLMDTSDQWHNRTERDL